MRLLSEEFLKFVQILLPYKLNVIYSKCGSNELSDLSDKKITLMDKFQKSRQGFFITVWENRTNPTPFFLFFSRSFCLLKVLFLSIPALLFICIPSRLACYVIYHNYPGIHYSLSRCGEKVNLL